MMRIDNITAAYHSIIWFACDVAGHVVIANSNEGAIPEFVACDRDRAQLLADKLCGMDAIDRERKMLDYDVLAGRGFYCFANIDPFDGKRYELCAKPQNPIVVEKLQTDVQELLYGQRLPVDFMTCDCFYINE